MTIIFIVFVSLIVNFFISLEVGKLAETRELGKEKGFWFSFLLGPFIGLLFVLASRQLTNEQLSIKSQEVNVPVNNEKQDESQLQGFLIIAAMIVFGLIWSFTN